MLIDEIDTVHEMIEYQCEHHPQTHCFSIYQHGEWRSYCRSEFWERVKYWTTFFSSSLPTQSVLILFIKKIDVDLFAAFIGAMRAGHWPAQLSHLSSKITKDEYKKKISHILEITGASTLFIDESDRLFFDGQNGLNIFTPIIPSQIGSCPLSCHKSKYALIQFSSGTTGLQKGIVLTHANIINHMKHYSSVLRLSQSDSIVSWLPLYHDMGLIACFLMPLMYGIPFYQIDPFDWILQPNIFLQTIEKYKTTICFLPNFAYHVLAKKGRHHDLSSMRLFVNCSEPAREIAHQQFLEKFPSVNPRALTVSYALAENTFAVSQSLPESPSFSLKNVLSCGLVIPGTEVKIFNPNNEGEGEIGIRGELLFHHFSDGTLPFLQEGFYLTGDLGFIHHNHLFVTARKKDIIIINGKNLYPQDVESVTSNIPGVYPGRVVAFGIYNDEIGSEELFIIVERENGVDSSQVRQSVQKAIYSEVGIVPKRVEVVNHMTLVKTSSGKICRIRNKLLYQTNELNLL